MIIAELRLRVLSLPCTISIVSIIAANSFASSIHPSSIHVVNPVVLAGMAGMESAPELDSSELLRRVRETYRSGPVADRVEMSAAVLGDIGSKPPRALRSVVTAMLDASGQQPSMKLELSDLVLHAQGHKLIGVNRLEQRTCAVVELSGLTLEGLADHLPPIPLPQVAFAFGKENAELFKGMGAIAWNAPARALAGTAVIYSMSGTHKTGTIDLKVDGSTWRLMQVNAQFSRPSGKTQVTLDVSVVDAGESAKWPLDIAGREQVSTLAQLRARTGEIKSGQKLPNLTANAEGFASWSIVDAFAENRRKTAAGERPADAMLLLLFRANDDEVKSEALLKDAQAGQHAMATVLQELRRQSADDTAAPSVLCEAIAVFEIVKFERERPAAITKTWADASADLPARQLHWSLSANATIDRISPNAGAVIVVILPDLSLAGIVPLDGRSADAAAIATDTLNVIRGTLKKP